MTPPAGQPINVLIADDDVFVRQAIEAFVTNAADMTVVGCAATGTEAVALAGSLEPDVVIMDVRMPAMDGVDATAQILQQNPKMRILMWTSFESDDAVGRAMSLGAAGFLLKTSGAPALLDAIRAAHAGLRVLSDIPLESWHTYRPPPPRSYQSSGSAKSRC